MIGVSEPENVAHVLDYYVLETASGAEQRNAALPCKTNDAKGAVHVAIGTRRTDEEPRETGQLTFEVGIQCVGCNPLHRKRVRNVTQRSIRGLVGCFGGAVIPDNGKLRHAVVASPLMIGNRTRDETNGTRRPARRHLVEPNELNARARGAAKCRAGPGPARRAELARQREILASRAIRDGPP